jgi:hypothetical protein
MSEFDEILSTAFDETLNFIGETILHKGVSYKACVNSIEFTEELLEGGILSKRGITAVISHSPFLSLKVGDKIIYRGKGFRILEIGEDSISYELKCETDSK